MKAVKNFFVFGILTLILGHNYAAAQETKPTATPETAPTAGVAKTNANEATAPRAGNNEKYRIGFQDTLEIQVFRNSRVELAQNVNVNPDGTIRLPRLESPIVAVCKTERELADNLIEYYKVYLKNPFVNVRAVEQRSQPFAVVGAVEKPGNFFLNKKVTLLELLAFAGGPDAEKAGTKVQVARLGNVSGCRNPNEQTAENSEVEFLRYNLNSVLEGKENPWMQPGDIVSVLLAEEAYIVGNVMKPTKIPLRETRTLTQAIAEAGGLNKTAKTDKIIIQRQESGSKTKTELVFNLKDIRNRKISDPELLANDIVVVDNDSIKSARDGFLQLVKTSFPFLLF